jgi:hypothetical protein
LAKSEDPSPKQPGQNSQRCGSSGKVPASQAWSLEFKPQYRKKKKKKAVGSGNLVLREKFEGTKEISP